MIEDSNWRFSTIPALCERAASIYGDAIAIEDGVSLTFHDVDALRRRAAKALIAAGVLKGDRVMIWAPNSYRWFIAALGLVTIGAVLIPASTRYKSAEIEELAARSGASFLFSAGDFLGQYYPDQLTDAARRRVRLVVVIEHARTGDTDWDAFLASGDAITDEAVAKRQRAVGPDDLCDMLFTSGTTGFPKGVMYGHRQALQAISDWADRVGIRRGDRLLVIPPFFHAFGYRSGAIVSLMRGATLIPQRTYDADDVLRRIARDRISVIPGPPTIFQGMLQHPEMKSFDRSSLRLGITGGAVIPAVLVRRMREELGFEGVVNGYGLTECGGYGAMCSAADDDETIANTAGKPFPGVELGVMDADGRLLEKNKPGEIVLRGYFVMKGYFNDEEATRKTIDPEGWLHTGDIGYVDDKGNLHIEDRLKEMYISGGFNCYPAEIERLMSAHPAVGQIAVIGVPDERLGEVGKAFVVLRPGAAATEQELIAWARETIANFKAPRSIEFRGALPTSAQGKVLKNKLREETLAAG
ncbi:FadD3 family acyl-CoA ligase [Terrarubrum flagellatum]|uniref:FadD3 family acyl-CoA ligase n=1 Tax=Terrirubrum flagellatum TaxID=2895980 RepID=UPI003144D621